MNPRREKQRFNPLKIQDLSYGTPRQKEFKENSMEGDYVYEKTDGYLKIGQKVWEWQKVKLLKMENLG